MEIIRQIIQEDQSYTNLLARVLSIPNKKVVLKIGKKDKLSDSYKPNYIIEGSNTNFMVFLT